MIVESGPPRSGQDDFSQEVLVRFGQLVAENIANGPIPFRKGYLRALLDRVEVDDDVVRLMGNTHVLAQAVKDGPANVQEVRRSVPKWRARRDIDGHCDHWEICRSAPARSVGMAMPCKWSSVDGRD